MRRLAPALFVLAAACPPAPAPVDTAADEAAVRAVQAQEAAALNSRDTTMAYVSDDVVMMPPGGPAVVGKAATQAWVGEFMRMFAADVNYTSSNVMVAGDLAVEHYTGTLTMTPVGGGPSMSETVKGIHVYRRQADGSWKMTHDVWNTDAATQ